MKNDTFLECMDVYYISILFILFLDDVKFAATHLQNMGVGIVLWTILMVCPFMILSRYF